MTESKVASPQRVIDQVNLARELEEPSRYVVGIDLGTTNSAVCYVDTLQDARSVEVFAIPQWVAAGQFEPRDTLPSFHFQPAAIGANPRLPWQTRSTSYVVGVMARDEGRLAPDRLIVSAKSWLCHPGIDRTAEVLPWHGAADVERLSPIDVSARYLSHMREAWDMRFPGFPMAHQDVVLTLPASFDEVARELTVQAAAQAGLARVVLIEEPQAAFYAWVDRHRDQWHTLVSPGQKILVCDIGGGTSDFTLIRVRQADGQTTTTAPAADANAPAESQQQSPSTSTSTSTSTSQPNAQQLVQFHRIAVGDHLILGGDNLDLALAKFLEQQLTAQTQLDARQWDVLVRTCRQAKETLLGAGAPDELTLNLPGTSSRLIGGGLQILLTRGDAWRVLLEGFFPHVRLDEKPQRLRSGLQEFGLPYAAEPAVTRHLAAFLTAHRHADDDISPPTVEHDPARPDLVLFNGGVFASSAIQERLVDELAAWFRTPQQPDWRPVVLENDRLDLAVARGAAYYGMVRRGEGVRIAAGLARSYYIEVGGADDTGGTAVCVVPGRAQPGETIDLNDLTLELRVSEPVEFPLYVSSTRLTDRPGQAVPIDPSAMRALPPLRTALRTQRSKQRDTIPVKLHAHLSEIGTIELWCSQIGGEQTWRLQFDVRAATETDRVATESAGESEGLLEESAWRNCALALQATFGPPTIDRAQSPVAPQSPASPQITTQATQPTAAYLPAPPGALMNSLTEALQMDRADWPMSLLRRIWEQLMELQAGRQLSAAHEARWLNLLGYSLRPGYGMAVDDWRVTETWRHVQGKLVHSTAVTRNESWILWRRIAAGLPAGQQRALADPLIAAVRALHRRMTAGVVKGDTHFTIPEFAELWRLLGSLELLGQRDKAQLGSMLLDLLPKRKLDSVRGAILWTLGRLGNRVPLYGPLNTTIDATVVAKWVKQLLDLAPTDSAYPFALMQLSRCTGDRHRDLPSSLREQVAEALGLDPANEHLRQLVLTGGALDTEEQQQAFGESLPKGLRISAGSRLPDTATAM